MNSIHNIYWEQPDMKTILKSGLVAVLLAASATASADWSANLGFASEYYYRGIFQSSSSASGGLDFESGGFYAGTWAADVGDGLEVDLYGGYGGEVGDFSWGVGFTGYYYTGDFDETYQEINLSAGYSIVTLDVAIGEWDSPPGDAVCNPTIPPTGCNPSKSDYTFYSLTVEKNGFYGKYGAFEQDFEGSYFEAGYGATVSEIDLGVSLIFSDSDLVGESDEAIVFTIGKSFDL
jgi:uncharacterized protein (TIGR02001 family)